MKKCLGATTVNNNTLHTNAADNQESLEATFFNPLSAQVIEGVPTHITDIDSDLGSMVIMSGN